MAMAVATSDDKSLKNKQKYKQQKFDDHTNSLYIDINNLLMIDFNTDIDTIESLIDNLADLLKYFNMSLEEFKQNSIERAVGYKINNEKNIKNNFNATRNEEILQQWCITSNNSIYVSYNTEYNTIVFSLNNGLHNLVNFNKYIEYMSYLGPIKIVYNDLIEKTTDSTIKYLKLLSNLDNVVEIYINYDHKDLQNIEMPKNLKYLHICFKNDYLKDFNYNYGFKYPKNLDTICVSCDDGYFTFFNNFNEFYNGFINNLPSSVSSITIQTNNRFNFGVGLIFLSKSYCVYPSNLKILCLRIYFAANFGDLPPTLEYIEIHNLCTSITNLPISLKTLHIKSIYKCAKNMLENSRELFQNCSVKINGENPNIVNIDFKNNYFNENFENLIISESDIYILKDFMQFPSKFKHIIIKTPINLFCMGNLHICNLIKHKMVFKEEIQNIIGDLIRSHNITQYGIDDVTITENYIKSHDFQKYNVLYSLINNIKAKYPYMSINLFSYPYI
jgi:hypothetical protein